jgi:tetratricopeptide (TPR) repeat protein
VRDAHSLYLQTLAELGPLGLALLLGALLVPVALGIRLRRTPVVPFVLAAYCAYLVHATADWDWQLPGVTVPAIFCASALVVAARSTEERALASRSRILAVCGAGVAVALAFFMVLGNVPLTKASSAADAGRWSVSASEARTAARWLPWSAEPWRMIGEADLALRNLPGAEKALQKAISKDPKNWQLWFDLCAARSGPAAKRALARAAELNPLSPEIAQLRGLKG